jgi:hypothetical protein
MNATNLVTSKTSSLLVKKLDAMTDKKRGDRPNKAMLVPAATPLYSGKFFEAANSDEKYLRVGLTCIVETGMGKATHDVTVPSPAIK